MLHVSKLRPGPAPRQNGSEAGGQRLSSRSQAAPDRRSFLSMVAHAPVAAMAAEGSAAADRTGNGASPAQLDGLCDEDYPTIEHQAWTQLWQECAAMPCCTLAGIADLRLFASGLTEAGRIQAWYARHFRSAARRWCGCSGCRARRLMSSWPSWRATTLRAPSRTGEGLLPGSFITRSVSAVGA